MVFKITNVNQKALINEIEMDGLRNKHSKLMSTYSDNKSDTLKVTYSNRHSDNIKCCHTLNFLIRCKWSIFEIF